MVVLYLSLNVFLCRKPMFCLSGSRAVVKIVCFTTVGRCPTVMKIKPFGLPLRFTNTRLAKPYFHNRRQAQRCLRLLANLAVKEKIVYRIAQMFHYCICENRYHRCYLHAKKYCCLIKTIRLTPRIKQLQKR
jgi:hypothetical protein